MPNTNRTKLRTAIIGCGKVAATHAAAWKNLATSEFVGVCDRNRDRAAALAERFGVPSYMDLDQMLKAESADVLSICTHHTERVPLIETAARRGVHVVVEKPITTTIEDCDRCLAIAAKARIQVGVVSQGEPTPLLPTRPAHAGDSRQRSHWQADSYRGDHARLAVG
jgi:UDP-N-acetyl-2-amino-2-deoxyglucuronate dehydrogenase